MKHRTCSFTRVFLAIVGFAWAHASQAQPIEVSGDVSPGVPTNPTWNAGLNVYVGQTGYGNMTIDAGGTVINDFGWVGNATGSQGLVTINGGGTWTNNFGLSVGYFGNGTLNLDGGHLTSHNSFIGFAHTSTGEVGVNGPTWTNSGNLTVGNHGNGSLNVIGHVTNTNGYVGFHAGSTGDVDVSGGGIWTNSAFLYVGNGGSATMSLQTGGTVTNTHGFIGNVGGSTGTVTVDNGNWTNSNILHVGYEGNGTMTLSNGSVTNTDGYVGNQAGSTGTVTVGGGTWASSGNLIVGNSGNGTVTVTGGNVTSGVGLLGNNSGSTGTVYLNGGTWTASQVQKGAGAGTLTFNGGTLRLSGNQTSLFSGFGSGHVSLVGLGGTIDTQAFSVATDIGLTGNGSLTKAGNGTLTLTADNTFGDLSIENGAMTLAGGNVTSSDGLLGNNSGSTGTVNITGGTWTISETLLVGNYGAGTMNLTNGTVNVFDNSSFLGFSPGSTGTVNISGGTWITSDFLIVGNLGSGTMTLTGGNVISGVGSLASNGGTGTVHLNGGTWTASQVEKGAGAGTLTFNGGTLRLSGNQTSLFSGFGSGHVSLVGPGGTIDTQSFNVATALGLSGNGSLTKAGNGTLTLTGNNSYSGGTVVSAGKLLVNNSSGSGLGTGIVTVGAGATLGGNGSFAGAVLVGGTLAPGNSIGTLASGPLSFLGDSTFAYEIDSSLATSVGADFQVVSGDLAYTGTVDLTLTDLAAVATAFPVGTEFSLINYTGTWDGGFFTFDSTLLTNGAVFTAGLNTWQITYNDTTGGLNFTGEHLSGSFVNLTAVPEPSIWALLALSAVAVLFLRRRRSAASDILTSTGRWRDGEENQ